MSAISEIVNGGVEGLGRFYSLYRGIVLSNEDEANLDRLKVYVPELNLIDWALPTGCFGYTGGGFRAHPLPEFRDIVFVSFENGDPGKPLWAWHGWGLDEMPDEFKSNSVCGIITPHGTKVLIDDETGVVYVEAPDNITLYSENSLTVSSKDINILASDTLTVNKGTQCVPRSADLAKVLNKLVKEVDALRTAFNSHTHPGVQSGGSTTAPTVNQLTKPISTINKTDFENDQFKH